MFTDVLTNSDFYFIAFHFFALGFVIGVFIMGFVVKHHKATIKKLNKELNRQYEYNSYTLPGKTATTETVQSGAA